MKKLIKWIDIKAFFYGWGFEECFVFGCCLLISFIAGIMAKGYFV